MCLYHDSSGCRFQTVSHCLPAVSQRSGKTERVPATVGGHQAHVLTSLHNNLLLWELTHCGRPALIPPKGSTSSDPLTLRQVPYQHHNSGYELQHWTPEMKHCVDHGIQSLNTGAEILVVSINTIKTSRCSGSERRWHAQIKDLKFGDSYCLKGSLCLPMLHIDTRLHKCQLTSPVITLH